LWGADTPFDFAQGKACPLPLTCFVSCLTLPGQNQIQRRRTGVPDPHWKARPSCRPKQLYLQDVTVDLQYENYTMCELETGD
jgi:hypothetical protein